MFDKWIKQDIEAKARKCNCVVVSDPHRFLTFMIGRLGEYGYTTLETPSDEMNARLYAKTPSSKEIVILHCFFPSDNIIQLWEFKGTGGLVNLDDPESYIRKKLYDEGLGNVHVDSAKLLLAAKLSIGKDFTWWKGIANETIDPLDFNKHLAMLIENPTEYQSNHDKEIYEFLRSEVFKRMRKQETPVDATILLRELSASIFNGLAENKINSELLDIYDWWSKDTSLIPALKIQLNEWQLPAYVLPEKAHIDHPFDALDRKLLVVVGDRLRSNSTLADLTETIRRRINSRRASEFKPSWLADLLTLLDFDTSGIYKYNTLANFTKYYRTKFAALDAAMRHLYNYWLGEPKLLKPLQELYEQHMKSLLDIWLNVAINNYNPTQLGIIASALNSGQKVAVVVCDGLRLEIAETIANKFPNSIDIRREVRFAKLPSVTENGMSALFGVNEVVNSTATRFDKLRQTVPNVEIVNYAHLGSISQSDKLVVMFGDIDQVGEKKGLDGLHDINNYEADLTELITRLHRMGYADVYLTADHGFVITGLLDEASKVPAPVGVNVKERFFLTDDYIADDSFIRREDIFPGGRYQYYAKTDKPFRTRGAYGYAHGGFTPQECLIPLYDFTSSDTSTVDVKIVNYDALNAVTGQFFNVRIKGNDAAVGKRLKVSLFNNKSLVTSAFATIRPEGEASAEFEMSGDNLSVVVQDATTSVQLDSATVKKSSSRDLDDLF